MGGVEADSRVLAVRATDGSGGGGRFDIPRDDR
jgi:hypothetical protein